jgi:hypothetical protein
LSKGSLRRPPAIDEDEMADRWALAFGAPTQERDDNPLRRGPYVLVEGPVGFSAGRGFQLIPAPTPENPEGWSMLDGGPGTPCR